MSTLSVRLPDSLHKLAKETASQDHVSMNQFIATAVAEKVAALSTESYLKERAARASEGKFRAALAKVPDVLPEVIEKQ
ncbi:MAG: toxin-antitoxin system HicB family antitoxin [Azonexus sp.]|nr:toxin-antitoxin system HicB family antitoxin [Betaproteobacteria bacterium]MBK8919514.1 toxin-antitoxin system HicB family antitoxin [Betaproteobacteria bacterium]MBP6036282.1 toxin-antitoxin system HicB family antitoxin [Azonexus sp.]MBP6906854.1 toxin-antitoxin system HicB family antitoxin [Azonexus sp.]